VTNVRGDTVRTITGPGGPGLHRAYWDLRTRPRPLGPAALRDSINTARVRRQREDSVRAARTEDTTAGGGRRRGQGGGGAGGEINLRPAEGPIGGAAAGGGGGGGEGGGGFGGGRNGNLVDAGDYLVTINAAGQTMRQVVHVERVGDIINADFGPDEDDEGGEDPYDR
jgi:hypothetical protein